VHIRSWMIGILMCITTPLFAASYPRFGASLSIPIMTKDPQHLHGYRAAAWYQPKSLIWKHVHIYFDASFGRWWVTNTPHYQSLNIYSVSPTLRYYFLKNRYSNPFINLSIGVAYLTRTRIDHQNLGMHFAFQDQLGIGASFGKKNQLSVSLSALHYSNASLCQQNAGITIPIMINAEYGFT
jgi:hypothetical protein